MDSRETHSSGLFRTLPSAARDDDGDEPVGLISAKLLPLTGVTMEACMQNSHNKGFMCSQPSPPLVAMSLRARESWALALKDIFDQQINNSASSNKEQRQQMAGFQGMQNQSMPNLRKRIPELDLSFKRAQDTTLPHAQLGFGSPITTPTNQSSQLQTTLPMQHNHLPHLAAFTRPNPASRQATAQMTIFYSGNVNVYDDVPADKAHAIMLLAGNTGSSSFKCPAPPSPVQVSPPEVTTTREGVPSPPVKTMPSQHASVTSSNDKGGGIARSSPSPAAASLASPPPSPAQPANGAKSSQAGAVAKRPHAGIELPHARKASLARFLEKRKDRVQVQQQDQQGAAPEKGEPMSCNDEPDHVEAGSSGGKKRLCSRSPSPTRSSGGSKEKNNTHNNKASNDIPSMNEHRFFR